MKGTTKEQRGKTKLCGKSTDSNSKEEKRVNDSPIEKPHLKNIEQTSQNGH